MTYTNKEWGEFYKNLGKQLYISARVVHHVRNVYQTKYADDEYEYALVQMRREAKHTITELKHIYLPCINRFMHWMTSEIVKLETETQIRHNVEDELPHILDIRDKIGFYMSIIRFTLRKNAPEQMRTIMETLPKGGETKG